MSDNDRTKFFDDAEVFSLIIESSTDFAIFTTDLAGLTTSWNIGAERLFGHSEAQIVGECADILFTPEDRAMGVPDMERSRAATDGRALDERWHLRRTGERFWASGLLMPLKNGRGFVKIARDRSEQHAASERLHENEERFRILATSIPQLVFRTRPDGERTWPSPQWIDFTGVEFEDSLGLGWLDAIHPDDRPLTMEAWGKARQTGEYYAEHRVWSRRNDEYRWHQTRAKPISEESLAKDWVGTMTDIHDLRDLQGRQQVMMAELQHRTRNLLAVVQSIASQTLRKSTSLDAFKAEFEGRLQSIGRVQSLLARVDQNDIDLRSLLEAELAAPAYEAMQTGRVTLEGPPVALPATSAQAFALGIHELATNAVKYGALGSPTAKLSVNWSVQSGGPQREVKMEWRESGVSLPDSGLSRRKGYGSELIERALPYQLKAKTRLEFGTDGVLCVLIVPIRTSEHGDA